MNSPVSRAGTEPGPSTHAATAAGPSSPAPATPSSPARPTLRAEGLALTGAHGDVFGPVDWTLDDARVGAVTGRQGSGRSALLLALAVRLSGVRGRLHVGDVDAVAHPRRARRLVSVGRIGGVVDLEPNLTVAESRDERALAEGLSTRTGRERFAHLEEVVDHRFPTEDWTGRLPAVERALLTLVLGCLRPAEYVVVDDLDDDLTGSELQWVHDRLDRLAGDGHRFVVSLLGQSALPHDAAVLHLRGV